MAGSEILEELLDSKLKHFELQLRKLFREVLARGEEGSDESLRIDVHLTRTSPSHTAPSAESRRLFSQNIDISKIIAAPIADETSASRISLGNRLLNGLDYDTPPESACSRTGSRELIRNTRESDSEESNVSNSSTTRRTKRRKATGGLHLSSSNAIVRRLPSDLRNFPKRIQKGDDEVPPKTSLDRLVEGVWTRIHDGPSFDIAQLQDEKLLLTENASENGNPIMVSDMSFRNMNILCRNVTSASQTCRALELIVQARWVDHFNARVKSLAAGREAKNMKFAVVEASQDFGWTEKHLRNRMAVWAGYHQIKEAGGWVPLIFSGPGIYRFCKYRGGFDSDSMRYLESLRDRFELAADTIHPEWRQLLTIVGESPVPRFSGHPLDWVVRPNAPMCELSSSMPVLPLKQTYVQWDVNFSYRHIDTCEIDRDAWGDIDPRQSLSTLRDGQHFCLVCDKVQSDVPKVKECECFPEIFGGRNTVFPVQVFETRDGRNNGLLACCTFPRGVAIGEFVGLVTAGLKDLDTMEGRVGEHTYQIWQGREGNHTRFTNHSCQPNSQFQKFYWLGIERVLLVSKGVEAGDEITVDYSDGYWRYLSKVCLCGESACRYGDRQIE